MAQLVPLEVAARHPQRLGSLARRHDDSHSTVAAASHGSTPSVHKEAHQEAVSEKKRYETLEFMFPSNRKENL